MLDAATLAWILASLLVLALTGLGITIKLLLDARREAAAVTAAADSPEAGQPAPRTLQAANLVMKVVETASKVREQGVSQMLVSSLDDFSHWVTDQRAAIARVAADDGTVTIFFSDIEGSTALNASLGDERWVRLLQAHDDLVRLYVEKYRGHVVKTQGDGYMVVFSTPELAINAAMDIQRALGANWNRSRHLRRTPIRVRIGLHTGTAIEKDGDFFGQNVAMAARVAAQAQGGEILVTGEIAESLADDFEFIHAEAVELKGFEGEYDLWHVEVPRKRRTSHQQAG